MRFDLVDRVLERSDERIVTIKQVTAAEEYLQDHFPTYPVLPGVLMLEAMVQAARELAGDERLVLGEVRALKYGAFVRPGASIRVEVELASRGDEGSVSFKGAGSLIEVGADPGGAGAPTAVSGRFTLRPARI